MIWGDSVSSVLAKLGASAFSLLGVALGSSIGLIAVGAKYLKLASPAAVPR